MSSVGVKQIGSTFCVVTQPFFAAQRATIHHFEEESQGFNMNPRTTIVVSSFLDKMTPRHLY